MRRTLAILAALSLAACAHVQAPPVPKTPAQTLYAVEAGLDAAVQVATDYASLPRCGETITDSAGGSTGVSEALCSDRATVQRIDTAAHKASDAVRLAQGLVQAGALSSPAEIAARIAEAEQAVSDLTELTSKVKTR